MKKLLLLLLLFPAVSFANNKYDVECLALNIYYEARFENIMGQYAVAYVTENRSLVHHKRICNVVFAKNQFSWVKQIHAIGEDGKFNWAVIPHKKDKLWIRAQEIAKDVLRNPKGDFTQGSQWFIAGVIFPKCLRHSCKFVTRLHFVSVFGTQLFFNDKEIRHVVLHRN